VVATPRDSATLILLRDCPRRGGGVEVLMLRRHAKSAFLPGTYVFPGGAVEAGDCGLAAEGICRGVTSEGAHSIIADACSREMALGFLVATVREAFEEAGILLAYREYPELMAIGGEERSRFDEYRVQVREDPSVFASLVREEGLELAVDRLFYFAHWITPEVAPIRFDTRFFVAEAPPNQEALHDAIETTDSRWIRLEEVTDKRRRGELSVPFPTFCNIKELARFSSVAEVIASTHGKEIPAIQPLVNMLKFG
jgi:8-oxo-dGTP pyrophosphatase MutT (NUDIX family)